MRIEVSVGEIVDKLSILEIKKNNITDPNKLINVNRELEYLSSIVFNDLGIDRSDFSQLLLVNEELWIIEDRLRSKESKKIFDMEFVTLARSVYIINDRRSDIKRSINIKYGSDFMEEKSYDKY
jgi:hypothetical protein